MTSSFILDLAAIRKDVSVEAVARYFGGSHYPLSEKTRERILQSIAAAVELTAPQAVYRIFPIGRTTPGEAVHLENGFELQLPWCLTDAETRRAAAAIGTLGEKLEEHCRKLADKGELYSSTLFDAVGTAMLDLLSLELGAILQKECSGDSLVPGKRFAPGINGYPLEQQRVLFSLVDHQAIGVVLNSSAVMVPTKSISFFLLMTETTKDIAVEQKCCTCNMAHCQFRMNKQQPLMVSVC